MFRKTILAVTTVLAISTLALGCGETSALEPQDIAAKAVSAAAEVQTMKMEMSMSMSMDAVGGNKPMNMQMDMDASASMDVKDTELAMTMDMDMDIPEVGKQTMSTEMYVVDGWMYIGVTAPVIGEQWTKMRLDNAVWSQQNQLAQQVELLKTAIDVKSLGSESVDGIACYVLEVTPDMAALTGFINSQLGQQANASLPENVDLAKMFKSIVVKEWVAKDTYLPMKADMHIVMEINASDFEETDEDFDKMTMDMTTVIKYYDYNKPVSIELPAGATNAEEQ